LTDQSFFAANREIITAVILLLIMFILVMIVNHVFRQVYKHKSSLPLRFLNSILNVLICVVCIYSALSQFDITRDVSRTLLQSSTLIIAILTFAAQKALSNVIAGFSISASHPCEIGHKIKLLDGSSVIAEGTVTDMTIRHVVIAQYDGQSCIVPNSLVDNCVIVNTNYSSPVGNILEIEVAYDTDVELAKSIIQEVCMAEPLLIRKDELKITVSSLTSNGMILKFIVWTTLLDDNFTACSNIRGNLVKAFAQKGITIPYQVVDIRQGGVS